MKPHFAAQAAAAVFSVTPLSLGPAQPTHPTQLTTAMSTARTTSSQIIPQSHAAKAPVCNPRITSNVSVASASVAAPSTLSSTFAVETSSTIAPASIQSVPSVVPSVAPSTLVTASAPSASSIVLGSTAVSAVSQSGTLKASTAVQPLSSNSVGLSATTSATPAYTGSAIVAGGQPAHIAVLGGIVLAVLGLS